MQLAIRFKGVGILLTLGILEHSPLTINYITTLHQQVSSLHLPLTSESAFIYTR